MPFSIPRYGDRRRMRIGLLGGSFNPAHDGHLQVAKTALRRLRLDQVWLLVSPGNPLKGQQDMKPRAARLMLAQAIADGRRVVATDIEAYLGTRYTVDTLRAVRRRFPAARFVWLMGADNLAQLPRWRRWRTIVRTVPFAVMPRPTYNAAAHAGRAAQSLAHDRLADRAAAVLADLSAPAWVFLGGRENALSATALRKAARGDDPSLGSPPHPPQRA